MKLYISYQEAKSKFPKTVEALMNKLEEGTSKEKGSDPSEFEYFYSWCIRLGTSDTNLRDLLTNPTKRKQESESESESEISTVYLGAKKGRWNYQFAPKEYDKGVESPPKDVQEHLAENRKKMDEKRRKEEEARAKQSPQERQDKINDLLGQLQGTQGFMSFQVPKGNED